MCKLTDKPIDSKSLRDTLGCFPTGVAVVTTAPEGAAPADDDVVDAEFEEVDKDDKSKSE